MEKQAKTEKLLAPFRALDLTNETGQLCGKHLGDLGADVIKVERPGGDPSRNIGPFYGGAPDPEKSLNWFALNNNKRGITLNIETSQGRQIFDRLVTTADFVIETFPPGYLDRIDLGYSHLSQINPRIILTSITPFGQAGPYSSYKGSDITLMSMGGMMSTMGDPDRPPVRVTFPQSWGWGGLEGATATLIAHHYREVTGEGQHVDVSIQGAIATLLEALFTLWQFGKRLLPRQGPYSSVRSAGGYKVRQLYPCKDGYTTFGLYGGVVGATTNQALMDWMAKEGLDVGRFEGKDWSNYDMRAVTAEDMDAITEMGMKFFIKLTKSEFYEGARARRIMGYPVNAPEDIVADPQLADREFWELVEHPELGTTITYPGAFAKFSEAPCHIRRRAPLIGEHNQEIYEKELDFSRDEILILKKDGVI